MKRIEDVLDKLSVKYDYHKYNNSDGWYGMVEFWTNTSGQDIPVEFDFDGTAENFVKQFCEYAKNYDVDDEVELFIGMRGKQGVPNTVRELHNDCQEAKDTLMSIADELKSAISGEEINTYYIHFKVESRYVVSVKAKSLDEAKEKGEHKFLEAGFGDSEDITRMEIISTRNNQRLSVQIQDQ